MIRRLLIVGAALALVGVPVVLAHPASANHGQAAVYRAISGDCAVQFEGLYDSGDGNEQTWVFSIEFVEYTATCSSVETEVNGCDGFGSIEAGFVPASACAQTWSLGGTGDLHPYPNLGLDSHPVTIVWGSFEGAGEVTVVL